MAESSSSRSSNPRGHDESAHDSLAFASSDHSALREELKDIKSRNSANLTHTEALRLAIEATELSMKFMQIASSKSERSERHEAVKTLMSQAERIKSSADWGSGPIPNLIDLDPLETDAIREALSSSTSVSTQSSSVSTPSLHVPGELVTLPGDAAAAGPPLAPTIPHKSRNSLKSPKDCRQIPRDEQILLWRASQIKGGPFPPWSESQMDALKLTAFQDSTPYEDKTFFKLSPEQVELLEDWKRPSDALPPPFSHLEITDLEHVSNGPVMRHTRPIDLVQDAATDCSVVASMCAGVSRIERGHGSLLSQLFLPFDSESNTPLISGSGKYIMRLNFNGCYRKVMIDDRLPVSKNLRLLHVIDRNNPGLLWPALLEKAYLKLRGGYDFPGSNSGTDLWVLSGWIPESIFLHHENTDLDQIWERIRVGFAHGDVLITVGTGEITPKTEKALGLVGFHDYAVLDIEEQGGVRRILIKNPWVNGTTWKGQGGAANSGLEVVPEEQSDSSDEDDFKSAIDPTDARSFYNENSQLLHTQETRPGTFWMPISNVVLNFSTLYLNWNPSLFKYRCEVHFAWNLEIDRSPFRSFRSNPQFAAHCEMDDQVWFVLERHYNDRSMYAIEAEAIEYIALFAFRSNGQRVTLNRGAVAQLPFVDSPQTTLKLDMEAGIPMTIVPHEQQLASAPYTFTLRAFASYPVSINRARQSFADIVSVDGAWTADNSGGNLSSVLYSKNPQFALHLPSTSRVAVLLETLEESLSVHVKLLHGRGKRITNVMKQHIILDSGNHSKGCAFAALRKGEMLDPGDYTIVCNTFEANSIGGFKLHVESDVNASLNPIGREGAGRLQLRLTEATFTSRVRRITAPLVPLRYTTVYFTIKLARSSVNAALGASSSPIRLTIEYGPGPDRQMLIASGAGAYREAISDVFTEDVVLQPLQKGAVHGKHLWLTLERMAGAQDAPDEVFSVTAWPDSMGWADVGVWRDVDG